MKKEIENLLAVALTTAIIIQGNVTAIERVIDSLIIFALLRVIEEEIIKNIKNIWRGV